MLVNTFPVILEDSYMLSPSVKHFIFRSKQELPFHYLPGQFITIHFEYMGKTLRRSYSIANVPTDNNRIEFAAGFIEGGPGSDLLFNLQSGDEIQINGPFGRLTLKDEHPKRYILIATSTGVTPYRSMITELKKRLDTNPSLSIVILQGVQRREDILYCDEFLALASYAPTIQFRAYLSRESEENLLAHEHKGHVQAAFPDLSLNFEEDIVYLCGNPAMIDDAFTLLKEKGFSTQHVIREKYISAK